MFQYRFWTHQKTVHTREMPQLPVDYADYKKTALSSVQSKKPEQLESAQLFFNKLDRIPTKTVDETEKYWLAKVFVRCVLTSTLKPPIDEYLQTACALKKEVSAALFMKLFTVYAPEKEARLSVYIRLCQLLIDLSRANYAALKALLTHLDTQWQKGAWSEVNKALCNAMQSHLQEKFPEMDVEDVFTRFATKSDEVQFPLPAAELAMIREEYSLIRDYNTLMQEYTYQDIQKEIQSYIKFIKPGGGIPKKLEDAHCALISLICAAFRHCFGIFPFHTQMIAVLGLLKNPKGRIAQMLTGQGKSPALAILTGFQGCLGMQVFNITSSHDLALRDYILFKPFYELLGLSSFHACDNRHEVAHYDQNILYGTNYDFEFLVLEDCLAPVLKQKLNYDKGQIRVANVDEVDNFLMGTSGGARIAGSSTGAPVWFYRPIFEFSKRCPYPAVINPALLMDLRKELSEYSAGAFSRWVSDFSDDELQSYLENAFEALYCRHRGTHYEVENQQVKIVDHENTGAISTGMRWSGGLHQYIEIKEGLEPQPETLTIAAITPYCFLRSLFNAVFGLSGTLGEDVERKEILETYGIDSFDVSLRSPCLRETKPPIYCATQEEHDQALLGEVQAMIAQNRPVLLLFPSNAASERFADFLKAQGIVCQLFNGKQIEDKTHIICQAGHAGVVTDATNVAARGTDIILTKESVENGGLHVVFAFYPINRRVEAQGEGRAGRKEDPGSSRLILSAEDHYIKKLIPSQEKRLSLTAEANFIEQLNELRRADVCRQSKQRILINKRDGQLHHVLAHFSVALKFCYSDVEKISLAAIEKKCQTLKSADQLPQTTRPVLDPLFSNLLERASALLLHQTRGSEVRWLPLLEELQQNYFEHLQQEWGRLFTTMSSKRSKRYASLVSTPELFRAVLFWQFRQQFIKPLKPLIVSPAQAVLKILSLLLSVDEGHFAPFAEGSVDNYKLWSKELKKQYQPVREAMGLLWDALVEEEVARPAAVSAGP